MNNLSNIMIFINSIILLFFAACLVRAAIEDIFERRIPNLLCVGIAVSFVAYALVAPVRVDWLNSFLVAGALFVCGALLFSRGVMGGGDVKLITACGLWCGSEMILMFLLIMSGCGGVLAVIFLIGRIPGVARMLTMDATGLSTGGVGAGPVGSPAGASPVVAPWPPQVATDKSEGLPYGVAIAVAGLWVAHTVFWRDVMSMGALW